MSDDSATVAGYFRDSQEVLARAVASPEFVATVVASAKCIGSRLGTGGKLLIAGNGGSAGDAQHIAGEFVGRLNFDRAPLPAMALTTDSSVLSAVGNDYGFERVFERQVAALGRREDVLLVLSTSGRSPNVLRALDTARALRMATIGFTGQAGAGIGSRCDFALIVPSHVTQLIQQVHMTAAHIICAMVESELASAGATRVSPCYEAS